MQRLAGIMLVIGAILFVGGVSILPQIFSGEAINNPQLQAELIRNDQTNWAIGTLLLAVGALLSGIGMALLALHLHNSGHSQRVKMAAYVGAGAAVVAALLWLVISTHRLAQPPEVLVSDLDLEPLFTIYTLFNLAALIIIGVVLFMAGYPKWLSLLIIVYTVLIAIGLRDIPLFYYVPLVPLGIVLLLRSRSPQPIAQPA